MGSIHDGNILIIKIIRNNKKGWECSTLTFKEYIYTGCIEVIKVSGDHEAAFRFLEDLVADIAWKRGLWTATNIRVVTLYHTLMSLFISFLNFSTANLNYNSLNYKFICWTTDTNELWNNKYWIAYLLARFVLNKCPRKPQQRSNFKLAPMTAGQISANIFSIHDMLLHSSWLLIQMVINQTSSAGIQGHWVAYVILFFPFCTL